VTKSPSFTGNNRAQKSYPLRSKGMDSETQDLFTRMRDLANEMAHFIRWDSAASELVKQHDSLEEEITSHFAAKDKTDGS